MISRVFHANLELFMFAFLWYLAIAFERGLFCSAHILTLPSAHTNAFVHFLYPSFCKPNLCLRMRGRLYNRDYTSLAGELHLTYLYRVPAYCKMSGYRQYTFADPWQAQQISRELLPAGHDSMQYLDPITSAYKGGSNDGMRAAIFPNYFHGKCQRNGVDPLGCPNPDCPVICGTPGSLVHFFPTLRFIAFNYTRSTLQRLCSPGSDAYERAERSVVQTAAGPRGHGGERRRVPWFEYAIARAGGELAPGKNLSYVYARRREEGVKKRFEDIMKQVPILLEQACGGHPSEDENALPKCSWENLMKQYILNFP